MALALLICINFCNSFILESLINLKPKSGNIFYWQKIKWQRSWYKGCILLKEYQMLCNRINTDLGQPLRASAY